MGQVGGGLFVLTTVVHNAALSYSPLFDSCTQTPTHPPSHTPTPYFSLYLLYFFHSCLYFANSCIFHLTVFCFILFIPVSSSYFSLLIFLFLYLFIYSLLFLSSSLLLPLLFLSLHSSCVTPRTPFINIPLILLFLALPALISFNYN